MWSALLSSKLYVFLLSSSRCTTGTVVMKTLGSVSCVMIILLITNQASCANGGRCVIKLSAAEVVVKKKYLNPYWMNFIVDVLMFTCFFFVFFT